MKKKYEVGDLLVVDWHDIVSIDVWVPFEDAKKTNPISVVSVGFLVNDENGCIRLSSTYCEDACNLIVIPKSNVDKIIKVNYTREN